MQSNQAKLIVITGCSGGGKSTIINVLAEKGYAVMPEAGREIVQEQLERQGNLLPWKDPIGFAHCLIEKNIDFYNQALSIANTKDNVIFFDRSLLDALCYLESQKLFSDQHKEMSQQYRYNSTVFILPPWHEIYQQDSERQHGFAEAVAEYNRLITFYPKNGYQTIEVPKMSIAERVDYILGNIDNDK